MKRLAILILALFICLPVCAQDLDTTSVTDQFDSGVRGNDTTTCDYGGIGGTCDDGSEAVPITDSDGVTGTINYINTWAGASAGDAANHETPVLNITTTYKFPDYNTDRDGVVANTRPGATSPELCSSCF